MGTVLILSVYKTEDGKEFANAEDSRNHQASIDLAKVINNSPFSTLNRNDVLLWIKSSKSELLSYLLPHNIKLTKTDN